MLRFIICEDNKDFLGRLSNIINKVMMPYNFEYKISKFTEYNKEVEEIINRKYEQKVYVLDIELGDISGLEIASEIREHDLESIIIFVTSHNECKNDIFYSRLLAIDYIPKDRLWADRFENTIEYTVKAINKRRVLSFEFNYNSYRVPFDDILYIEKVQDNQKCIINTENGNQFEIITTISELAKKLGPSFFQSHKSCIVNIEKIKKINYADNTITFINNECVYLLSNRKKKQLREYVANY
ncbi:MAG: LytTR family DNA-binding domain-containing protein [Erysipelotrichaceae bacterium]|nr:LytTR family DNA-binding domain-containing protein [Erysipelotrichaceae bacterium]